MAGEIIHHVNVSPMRLWVNPFICACVSQAKPDWVTAIADWVKLIENWAEFYQRTKFINLQIFYLTITNLHKLIISKKLN